MANYFTADEVRECALSVLEDHEVTAWITFAEDDRYVWALVFGWYDDGYGDEGLVTKFAYCPHNSAMNEYDYDWMMPYDKKTGEVDDTDTFYGDGEEAIDQILRGLSGDNATARRFIKEYVGKYRG